MESGQKSNVESGHKSNQESDHESSLESNRKSNDESNNKKCPTSEEDIEPVTGTTSYEKRDGQECSELRPSD